jgi:heat shock protein HslJ
MISFQPKDQYMKNLFVVGTLALAVSGCADYGHTASPPRRHDPQAVMGRIWEWQGTVTPVETITVPQPERYTLRLTEQGRAELRFDCNHGGGSYRIAEGKLSFGPMMSTRMACPEDSMDSIYIKYLQNVNSFFVEGDSLFLELPADGGTLRYRRPPGTH